MSPRSLSLAVAPSLVLLLAACGGGSGAPSNRAPVAVADSVSLNWNTSSAPIAVLANDYDPDNDAITLVGTAQPAHGSVQINTGDSTITYRPATGYVGPDQFTYTIKDRFGATATGTVSVTVQAAMTLTSRVVGVANPTVTASVGGQTYTSTGNAEGAYSLPITASSGSAFITLEATGADGVRLRSLVGEVGSFGMRAANSDNVLADGHDSVLKLGSLSTARTALAMAANGGSEPATQAALDTANARIDARALLQRAASVRQVMTGTLALPVGVADSAALVQNGGVYNGVVEGQLAADAAALAEDMRLVQIDASQTVPFATPLTQPTTTVYTLRSGSARTAMVWTLTPGGAAHMDGAAATWAVSNGILSLRFANPQALPVPNANGGFTTASVTALAIRRHVGSDALGQASVQYTVAGAAGDWQPASYQASSRLAAPASADLTAGRWVGVPTPDGATDTLVLNADGTGHFERTALAVNWTRNDAEVVLSHADGTLQSLSRMLAYADGEERWLVRQPLPAVGLNPAYRMQCDCMVVRQVAGLAFTAAELPAQWRYQTANDVVERWRDGFTLNADGSGAYAWFTVGSAPQPRDPLTWTVNADSQAVLTSQTYERSWTKLAQSGDKVFILLRTRNLQTDAVSYAVRSLRHVAPMP